MKYLKITLILFPIGFCNCNQSADNKALQQRVDSLESQLATTYKPGFGEFMSDIKLHNAKLWFAGKNKNWELADFEINEIKEALSGISEYCKDRPETKELSMINLPVDSLNKA